MNGCCEIQSDDRGEKYKLFSFGKIETSIADRRKRTKSSSVMAAEDRGWDEKHKKKRQSNGDEKPWGWKAVFSRDGFGCHF